MASKRRTSQIAAQLYSVNSLAQDEKKAAAVLKSLYKIGYRNVQISGAYAKFEPLTTKRMCDDAGVAIIGAHIGLADMRADLSNVIDKLHVWNCDYVAIPSLPHEERNTLAKWRQRAKEFTKLGRAFGREGIILQYHNHCFEFEQFGRKDGRGGKTGLEILYANSDPKHLQAEIDTCWVARGGGDPAAWIARVKGRMDQVHFKDMAIVNNEPVFVAVGEGNLNWPVILKACKAIGVKDYIVEQDAFPITNNPLKSMAASYANLRKMGLK